MIERGSSRPLRVLGIGGSYSDNSRSLAALKAALKMADDSGAQTALADIRALDLPLYHPGWPLDSYPPSLAWLVGEARAADAYILCSPIYHGTITGSVKNALDLLEFLSADTPAYFGGKVVGLMALGSGGHNVINSLHHIVHALDGILAPTAVVVPGRALDPDSGAIADPAIARRLGEMVAQVLDMARRLRR